MEFHPLMMARRSRTLGIGVEEDEIGFIGGLASLDLYLACRKGLPPDCSRIMGRKIRGPSGLDFCTLSFSGPFFLQTNIKLVQNKYLFADDLIPANPYVNCGLVL